MNQIRMRLLKVTARAVVMLTMAAISAKAAAFGWNDIEKIRAAEFDSVVIEASEKRPVVVEFYADWCGYCRRLEPMLKELAREYRGRLSFVRVDVDRDGEAAARVGLRGVPTIVVFDDGMAVSRITGPASRSRFRDLFDSYAESD